MSSFRTNIRTRRLWNLLFKFTVWITIYGTLKPPKNITQLNTKFGFSVTHIPTNFIPPSQNLFTLQIFILSVIIFFIKGYVAFPKGPGLLDHQSV